jgi:serine/threonine-protein kinase
MELRQVGKYKIVQKLGHGAMGEVFRAHDPVLGRDVAIKVVTARLSRDERARERFHHEARAAAQLNHPNIITVYDFGEEQGMAYMAMELLEGADLRELLAKDALASLDDRLAIMEQVLDGLAFAHARGSCTATSSPATSGCSRTARSRSWTSASPGAPRRGRRPAT